MKGRAVVTHGLAFAAGWALRSGPLGWALFLAPVVLLGWLWGRFEDLPALVRWLLSVALAVVLYRSLRRQLAPLLVDDPGPGVPDDDPWAPPRDGRR